MPAADFSLDSVSVLLVWTAIAIYALAFIAYAVDLARRSDLALQQKDASEAAGARERQLVGAASVAAAGAAGASAAGASTTGASAAGAGACAEAAPARSRAPAIAAATGPARLILRAMPLITASVVWATIPRPGPGANASSWAPLPRPSWCACCATWWRCWHGASGGALP